MKVRVDADRCQGHNRCHAIAPDLFVIDDEGYAREAGDGRVPVEQEDLARLAERNCPEFAIALEESE